MAELYQGTSDSFEYITNCYMDYANEVICRRAFPDLRDGQKIVTRRILYTAYMNKKGHMEKCIPFVSDAVKLHPHGDQAVYKAFTLLTDENGSCNIPLFHGMGNLGKAYSSRKPADMRYPKAIVNDNLEDFFKDKEVMDLVPAEEGVGEEPKVLNAIYPVVLVNGTSGIGVSVASRIPSFNFGDVIELTVKYLRNCKLDIEDMIVPDFPTGGVIVRDDKELAKIMLTGKGKLRVRAKVEVEGKTIYVKEIPADKRVESIISAVNESGIKEITSCVNSEGINSKALVTIECRSKKVVEYVLMELYRRNILQNVYSSNIIVTDDDVPFMPGVYDIVKRWVTWRIGVVVKKFTKHLADLKEELETLDYFIKLISTPEWKAEYTRRALYESKKSADDYLHEIFEDIPKSVCDWINGRSISAFNRGGSYMTRYENLKEYKIECEHNINYPREYIINELMSLKKNKPSPRRTDITNINYKFSKITYEEEEDTSSCVWVLKDNGYLVKAHDYDVQSEDILSYSYGQANDILIGFDNAGRILRIKGNSIPYTKFGSDGEYMPKYFGGAGVDGYRVLYMTVLDGSKKYLFFRDGYISVFDTSEFLDKKVTSIVSNGLNRAVFDRLLEVVDEKDMGDIIVLADVSGNNVKVGITDKQDIVWRSRTGRSKLVDGKVNAEYLNVYSYMEIYDFCKTPNNYVGRMKKVEADIVGIKELVRGRYVDICKDVVEVE